GRSPLAGAQGDRHHTSGGHFRFASRAGGCRSRSAGALWLAVAAGWLPERAGAAFSGFSGSCSQLLRLCVIGRLYRTDSPGPGNGGCGRLVSAQGKTAKWLAALFVGAGSGASDGSVCASGSGLLVVLWCCRGAADRVLRPSGLVGLVVGLVKSAGGGIFRIVANVDAVASGPTACRLRGQPSGGSLGFACRHAGAVPGGYHRAPFWRVAPALGIGRV